MRGGEEGGMTKRQTQQGKDSKEERKRTQDGTQEVCARTNGRHTCITQAGRSDMEARTKLPGRPSRSWGNPVRTTRVERKGISLLPSTAAFAPRRQHGSPPLPHSLPPAERGATSQADRQGRRSAQHAHLHRQSASAAHAPSTTSRRERCLQRRPHPCAATCADAAPSRPGGQDDPYAA